MRKFILPTLLFCSAIILFFSCRKTDSTEQAITKKQNSQETRFFNVPATAAPQVKAIASAIKKQNEKHSFLSSVISKAGYPIWDKARIINYKNGTISGRSSSDSTAGEIVYVPFALDSQNRTNAVLSVTLNPSDSIYRMLYANSYRQFGYDTTDHNKWNARTVFQMFASFDYTAFGHKKFFIKDSLLFERPIDSTRLAATIVNYNGQDVSRTTNGWFCLWLDLCPVGGSGHGGGGGNSVRTASTTCEGGFTLPLCVPDGGSPGSPTSGWPAGGWIGSSNGTGPVNNPTGDPNNGGGGW